MGFSMAAAGAAGCRAPVQHAVPLPAGSDTIVPGVANIYATTCGGCPASCSLLVKQRDGRPIKVDGNDASALFGGGTCATGQATVLSLYDDARLRGPQWQGQPVEWQEVDRRVTEHLDRARAAGGKIVLLSGTITSPSTRQIIADFGRRFPTFRHVTYDGLSLSAMRAANAQSFGQAAVPHYAFDQARVIVALEADFLGTWLSPVEFARQYAAARRPESGPLLHVQIESGLSITGTNADLRIPVAPSDLGTAAVGLLARLARKAGGYAPLAVPSLGAAEDRKLDAAADALWDHRGESLVVSGSADASVQTVVNGINVVLGNVGKTLDLARPSLQRQGDDAAMAALVEEMSRGEIAALILYRVNAGYDYPEAPRFLAALQRVPLSISLADRRDETAAEVHAVCPDHHFLEAWGDAEPVQSSFSLQQPLIAPLHGTRAAQETLLRWQGAPVVDTHAYLRDYWRTVIFARQKGLPAFDEI
jgi:molybdopterin-containing oxidoreductase family iron-sulfur binding subunit